VSRSVPIILAMAAAVWCGGCAAGWKDAPIPLESLRPAPKAADARLRRSAGREVLSEYDAALALIADLEYAGAAEKLGELIRRFESAGDDPHTSEATFWLGFCREKLGDEPAARQLYDDVIRRFGDSSAAQQARERLEAMDGGT